MNTHEFKQQVEEHYADVLQFEKQLTKIGDMFIILISVITIVIVGWVM